MIRRDSAQEAERPHYYSQYWLDVAAGRPTGINRVVEAEPVDEDVDAADLLADFPPRPESRPAAAKPPAPEPKREAPRSLSSLADLANIDLLMNRSAEMEDETVPDIEAGAGLRTTDEADAYAPDLDAEDVEAGSIDDEAESLDDFADEDEEEEEDDEWGGGARRPKRQTKPPKRREPRRGF